MDWKYQLWLYGLVSLHITTLQEKICIFVLAIGHWFCVHKLNTKMLKINIKVQIFNLDMDKFNTKMLYLNTVCLCKLLNTQFVFKQLLSVQKAVGSSLNKAGAFFETSFSFETFT
jgi:hypothetical protein